MEIGIGLYGLLALAVALLASREFGRSAIGWFFLSVILTPLAGLLLFMLPPRRRPCPFCAEAIQPSAVVCRFCGREVPFVADGPGLPHTTKAVLLILVVAVLLTALSQCQYRFGWWSSDRPALDVMAPSQDVEKGPITPALPQARQDAPRPELCSRVAQRLNVPPTEQRACLDKLGAGG